MPFSPTNKVPPPVHFGSADSDVLELLRQTPTVVPMQSNARPLDPARPLAGGKLPMRAHRLRSGFRVHRRALGRDRNRVFQLQGPEWKIEVVAPHVAERAIAEVPKAPPLRGVIKVVIGAVRRRSEPCIVTEVGRFRLELGGAFAAPPCLTYPTMRFGDLAKHAALHDLHDAAVVVTRMDLRAHLRDRLLRLRQLGDLARLGNGQRERLLAVDMGTGRERAQGRRGMGVIRRADDNRVKLHLAQHLAHVNEAASFAKAITRCVEVILIDVTQSGDVLTSDSIDIRPGSIRRANDADLQLLHRPSLCAHEPVKCRERTRPLGLRLQRETADAWF